MGQGGQVRRPQGGLGRSIAGQHSVTAVLRMRSDVRYGSLADIQALNCDVRFTPESRHQAAGRGVC